jgi:hypothetical protein
VVRVLAYLLVAVVYVWVLFWCGRVALAVKHAQRAREVNNFAQYLVAFSVTISVLAVSLSLFMMTLDLGKRAWLAHYWALFDVFVAVCLVTTLRYIEKSLLVGRQG